VPTAAEEKRFTGADSAPDEMDPCLPRGHRDALTTLQHGLRVLEYVAANEGTVPKEISAALGLSLGTTYHLASTLLDDGYLERTHGGGLVLGDGLATLVERLDHCLDPYADLQSLLEEVALRAGGVAVVGRLVGHQVAIAAVAAAPGAAHADRILPGLRGEVHTTALGRALLAALDPSVAFAIIREPTLLPDSAELSASMRHAFPAQLDIVRARGLAVEIEEGSPGLCCAAARVATPPTRPRLALAVAVTPDRLRARPEALAALVKGAARRSATILAERV
jgi:IclR family acetate operon transcriptional repressor